MVGSRITAWLAGLALVVACGCLVLLLVDSGGKQDSVVPTTTAPAAGGGGEVPGSPSRTTDSQGTAGNTGSAGVPEAVAVEGPAGPRGKTGESGPSGAVGPAGASGATGPQGCEGPEGPAGPVGETGPQGCEGPVGEPGVAGPAGPQGTPGADGKTILNGSGPPAADLGEDGDFYIDTSSEEIYGPKTKDGWGVGTSAIGPEGPQGEAGTAGKSVLSGSGAPAESLGTDGDFYIDTSTNQIYGPKASGAWGTPVNLVGPQGPTGATGPEGPQGDQGPPGVDAADVPLYRGSFYSTGDQSPTGGTNVVPIDLDETDISQGVELVNPGEAAVKVVHGGTYNFQFSAQVTKTDSGTDVLYIWPQVDPDGAGTDYSWQDVPWSNSSIGLFDKDDRTVSAWNFVIPVSDGGYFRMVMSSTDTKFLIDSVPTAPVGPAIPGLILTVTRAG